MKNDKSAVKFLYDNPYSYKDVELLRMLLRFATDDAEELAERLMEQFGNIGDLMDVSVHDLVGIEGMNTESALLLRLVPELHRRYFLSRSQPAARLMQPGDYGKYILPYFYGIRNETVFIITLDAACKVINCRMLGEGSVNSANVPIRRIAIPSKEDVDVTKRLKEALALMEITLLDHLIIADDDFVSMCESGYLCF